ncbi:ABC transporter ATP-binding protein [Sporosalibacterium faouarense]|uniref:ABC transporter ATP-binding protein n=1 Tax=Sporosalibacterium faouarense TaxID=516123 RepID=UPI00192AF750|nr:ABC transporter ATP-binding protein [Sporosalibacterium faouarense]
MKFNAFNKRDKKLIIRSVLYVKPYIWKFTFLVICIILGMSLGLIQPLIIGRITTSFLDKKYDYLITIIAIFSGIKILEIAINFIRKCTFANVNNNLINDIRIELFRKVINLPVKAFDEMRIGDFLSRINGDTGVISNIITNQFLNTIIDLINVIIIGIIILKINAIVALTSIVIFPLSYLIFNYFGKILRKKNKELREISDLYFSTMQQSLFAIRELKSLGIKGQALKKFHNISHTLKEKTIRVNVISEISNSFARFSSFLSAIALLLVSGNLVARGELTIEEFVILVSYGTRFANSLKNITQLNSILQRLLSSLERIFDLLDDVLYKPERFGNKEVYVKKGDIKFNYISFAYNNEKKVINDFSLHIQHNETIAIVGRSGAGKSTIFNLLLKLYPVQQGRILVNDIEINEFSEKSLRDCISIVRQEPFLFNMSIKENLLLVKKEASENEIIQACKCAYIHDFIMALPNKYETIIGENGVNLSGGQKQRIAIARGLLKDSRIILFDEATSSLDNESQYFIKKAIKNLSLNRTVVIIAHRLSTVIDADEICVMNNGRLVDKGDHYYLLEHCDLYQRLYESDLSINNTENRSDKNETA